MANKDPLSYRQYSLRIREYADLPSSEPDAESTVGAPTSPADCRMELDGSDDSDAAAFGDLSDLPESEGSCNWPLQPQHGRVRAATWLRQLSRSAAAESRGPRM